MDEALDYLVRQFAIKPRTVLHIGGHEGQERTAYQRFGVERAVFVEPIPAVFQRLQSNLDGMPGFTAFSALVSDVDGEVVDFYIASNEESSSLLQLGRHSEFFPEITFGDVLKLRTTTADRLVETLQLDNRVNLLVIDTQGAEMKVLRGAEHLLETVDAVFLEVSEEPLYEGSCTLNDLLAFLQPLGFGLKWLRLYPTQYGDGLFVRNSSFLPPRSSGQELKFSGINVALNRPVTQSSYSVFSQPGEPAGVVNGVKTGRFAFHTDRQHRPWLEIDLQEPAKVSEVVVYNRMDQCQVRSRNLQIFGFDGERWDLLHDQKGVVFGGVGGTPLRADMGGRVLSKVRLYLADTEYLHLDQVEIYAEP